MKKIILFLIIGILVVQSVSALTVFIRVAPEFHPGETLSFEYRFISPANERIVYTPFIECPDLVIPLLEVKELDIIANQPVEDTFVGLRVEKNFTTQTCTAYLQIFEPSKQIFSEDFIIDATIPLSFDLDFCRDITCENKTKVFVKGSEIYLNYSSSVENIYIDAILTYPNKRSEKIDLPTLIIAKKVGTYEIEITVSKEGYETITKKEQFGVIETSADIQAGVIDDGRGEPGEIDMVKIIKYLVYFLALIFVILIFYLLLGRKRKRKY